MIPGVLSLVCFCGGDCSTPGWVRFVLIFYFFIILLFFYSICLVLSDIRSNTYIYIYVCKHISPSCLRCCVRGGVRGWCCGVCGNTFTVGRIREPHHPFHRFSSLDCSSHRKRGAEIKTGTFWGSPLSLSLSLSSRRDEMRRADSYAIVFAIFGAGALTALGVTSKRSFDESVHGVR